MVVDRRACLLFLLWSAAVGAHAQSILQRRVQVHAEHVQLSEALALIARDAGFKLSYNAALVNGDSVVSLAVDAPVKRALEEVVGRRLLLKESGGHVILLEAGAGKAPLLLAGRVVNARSGAPVPGATVYEVKESRAVRSGADGSFALEVSGRRNPVPLLVACRGFRDTVVYVARDAGPPRFALQPEVLPGRLEPLCLNDRCVTMEEMAMARLLVPSEQMGQALNLGPGETRPWQVSLIPSVGTNGSISGAVVNRWSFNVLAGYARGLQGTELGGVANLERRDVKGVQIAGLANLVGRDTKGVQVAGAVNHTLRSLEGLQLSGLANTVWDTLTGVQVSGGANVVKGGMLGTQVAGLGNLTTQNCDGAQVAGGFNVAVKDVRKTQVAGVFNYGSNVYGAQVAAGMNLVLGEVGGGQVAGALNLAREVAGGQVAVGVNLAVDTVRGGQVGVVNIARVVIGGQVGIVNISDTIAGTSIGLFSFARRGYHRLEASARDVHPLTLVFRTGTCGFHNIFSWSPPVGGSDQWGFGYGFGTGPKIGRANFLNIEFTVDELLGRPPWDERLNLLGRFSMAFGHNFGKHGLVSAGPAFNLLASDARASERPAHIRSILPDQLLFDEQRGNVRWGAWPGWAITAGIRF